MTDVRNGFVERLLQRLRHPSVSNTPPTAGEMRRNDWATVVWFVFLLVLGFGIRNNALNTGVLMTLGDELVTVTLPAAGWVQELTLAGGDAGGDAGGSAGANTPDTAGGVMTVSVWNSRSPSTFDATIDLAARRLRPGENLTMARAALSVQRQRDLARYRELQAETVSVLNLVPGTRLTYAFVADPIHPTGVASPPVVVQGQDILFIYRDHLITVSVAADHARWDAEARAFDRVYQSLQVREAVP